MVALTGAPVLAQSSPFSPVIIINGKAVSHYELDQRILFMTLLRQPGDIEKIALDTLIEDRLRVAEAERLGLSVTPEMVETGMTEFASRANLTAEEFVKAIAQGGVDAETFRDFVAAGMIWREVVRARYAGQVTITDAEIDRAMAAFAPQSIPTLRVAEIVLPGKGPERSASLALARKLKQSVTDEPSFFAAARQYSKGPTAASGGQRDWQRLTEFDEKTKAVMLGTPPGTISQIVQTDEAITLYLILDRAEDQLSAAETATLVDYAEYVLPAGQDAASVRAKVDTCDDLYDLAKGQPESQLQRKSAPVGQVPSDIAATLALLDTGESTAIARGGVNLFLMVCRRGVDISFMPAREDARRQLLNQRLGAMAEIYLEELRTEAIIREP